MAQIITPQLLKVNLCRAERNPGPEKPKSVTSRSITWRCLTFVNPRSSEKGWRFQQQGTKDAILAPKHAGFFVSNIFDRGCFLEIKFLKLVFQEFPLWHQTLRWLVFLPIHPCLKSEAYRRGGATKGVQAHARKRKQISTNASRRAELDT